MICSYGIHTKATPKYEQSVLSGVCCYILLSLLYLVSHSIINTPAIQSHLYYIECIREMGSADLSNTKIPEVAYKQSIQDCYDSTNQVIYIQQMLRWVTHITHI